MNKTLTYSNLAEGWVSFYSFIPEKILGMNSYLYTFKNGQLYQHNTNAGRNIFYDSATPYPSTVKSAFNDNTFDVKNYKTLCLNGNIPWSCAVNTNITSGSIDSSWFSYKEGLYYAFIRRNSGDNDINMRSAQGVGDVTSVNSTNPAAVILTFNFSVGSIMSVGDLAYKYPGGTPLLLLGRIKTVVNNVVTIDTTIPNGNIPSNGDFILYIKNSVAESYPQLGYYMQFELTVQTASRAELFSVQSDLFKSYP
jgi:hypothetical protein